MIPKVGTGFRKKIMLEQKARRVGQRSLLSA
jgi:hypothetical protein